MEGESRKKQKVGGSLRSTGGGCTLRGARGGALLLAHKARSSPLALSSPLGRSPLLCFLLVLSSPGQLLRAHILLSAQRSPTANYASGSGIFVQSW